MPSLQICLDLSVIGLWGLFFWSSLRSSEEKCLVAAFAKCQHSWNFHYKVRQAQELIEQRVDVSVLQGRPCGTESEMYSSAFWIHNISWSIKSVSKFTLCLCILAGKSRHEYFRRKEFSLLSSWVPSEETIHLLQVS